MAIGNLNAGSNPDLAVANGASDNVSVLLNAGPSHRTLTLSYRASKHRFIGRLTSSDPHLHSKSEGEGSAAPQRPRSPGRQRGQRRQRHLQDRPSANPGTYYARVRAWSACRAERSKKVTIG